MKRLERELNGELGQFWKTDAEKRVARVAKEFAEGKITIDEEYVLRNCINRVVTEEVLELVIASGVLSIDEIELISDNTNETRTAESRVAIEQYKARQEDYNEEELFEMRAAFGTGVRVINLITGKEVVLK